MSQVQHNDDTSEFFSSKDIWLCNLSSISDNLKLVQGTEWNYRYCHKVKGPSNYNDRDSSGI